MKWSIWIVLVLALCTQVFTHPCGGGQCCCGGSSCSACTSSCCSSGSSSCCSGRSTSCCNSRTSCCETETSCCENTTSRDCCDCGKRDPCPKRTTSAPTTPTITPTRPEPSPPVPIVNPSSTNNNNDNRITIPTNITIQNEIRNENHINIPVNVDVRNENNINIEQQSDSSSGANCSKTCDDKRPEKECCNNTVVVVTVTIPVPYPVRVPVYKIIPVPYIVTIPQPVPVPVGCCLVVTPCDPYLYGGCRSSSTHCSHHCSGQYMYQASNVCDMGCYKRDTAMGFHCGHHGGCFRSQIDCSMCHGNFHQNYEDFMMCSGCFLPMPWGMHG